MLDLLGWCTLKVVPYQLLRKGNTPGNANGVPRTSGGGGFWLALTQGTRTESIPCVDLSIHHLLLHLTWVTIYAHQAARGGRNVWIAHDKEETSAKMNSSTSVMLTKFRMFNRNLLFKCVDSFHIH